jgi:hypothetical protein
MLPFDVGRTPAMPALVYAAAAVAAVRLARVVAGLADGAGPGRTARALARLRASLVGRFGWVPDSPRGAFYTDLLIGSEFLLSGVALVSILYALYRRRAPHVRT